MQRLHNGMEPEDTGLKVLGCNEGILLKQRYLNASATYIDDGGRLFDDLLELFVLKSDGLVVEKSLL